MIYVPSKNYLDAEVGSGTGLCGYYKFIRYKAAPNGQPILASAVSTDWFPNLIVNTGLNRIGTAEDWLNFCQVGTGSATPAVTDTALQSRLASHSSMTASIAVGNSTTPPFFVGRRNTYRFNAGVATGTLSEVGVGWASIGSLFSRALILDGGGNPTTITVLADEVLDVVYEVRSFGPETDQTGNVTITGVGTLSYTLRMANAGSTGFGTISSGGAIGGIHTNTNSHILWTGAIGTAISTPSGSQTSATSISNSAYSNNSYQRNGSVVWGLASGTITVRSIVVAAGTSSGQFGRVQYELSSTIPKTASNVLTINYTHSWARR